MQVGNGIGFSRQLRFVIARGQFRTGDRSGCFTISCLSPFVVIRFNILMSSDSSLGNVTAKGVRIEDTKSQPARLGETCSYNQNLQLFMPVITKRNSFHCLFRFIQRGHGIAIEAIEI